MISAAGAHKRATDSLNLSKGNPVVPAKVMTGIPMAPNATGAVLASRHIAEALNAEKPRPTSIVAATATGVPKPAHPSKKAPKENATKRA
jgi:hypothetical protein